MKISVLNLVFQYSRDLDGFRLEIPELVIESGQQVAIIGPSGSGKSTLLKLVSGILLAHSGSVSLDNHKIGDWSDSLRRSFRLKNIGVENVVGHWVCWAGPRHARHIFKAP